MTDSELIEKCQQALGDKIVEITNPDKRRIFLKTEPRNLLAVVTHIRDAYGFTHVSTISGVDKGETFEILYHFVNKYANLNVRTEIPRSKPHVETITSVIPGAILYERELQDMFGMIIDNIPDPRPLVLPDNWPEGNFPLRKDWKHERAPEVIPGGES